MHATPGQLVSQEELFARWEAEGSTPEILAALENLRLMQSASPQATAPSRVSRDIQSEFEAVLSPVLTEDEDEDDEPVFLAVASPSRSGPPPKTQPASHDCQDGGYQSEAGSTAAPTADPLAAYRDKCVVLYTSMAHDQLAVVATRKIVTQLESMSVPFVQLDGMAPENVDARRLLWSLADAKPGTYPVVYSGATGFIGMGDELQDLIDNGQLSRKLGATSSA
jgi:hypothetical protein